MDSWWMWFLILEVLGLGLSIVIRGMLAWERPFEMSNTAAARLILAAFPFGSLFLPLLIALGTVKMAVGIGLSLKDTWQTAAIPEGYAEARKFINRPKKKHINSPGELSLTTHEDGQLSRVEEEG